MIKNKLGKYVALGVGSIFAFIISGIILMHLPACVRDWLSVATTVICFLVFFGGLYFFPKYIPQLGLPKKDTFLLMGATIFMLANFIFMYTTYALGFEATYPHLYGVGFNLITSVVITLLGIVVLLGTKDK